MVMKKLISILCSLFFVHCSFAAADAAQYNAALVADLDTGQILFKDRADELNYPASLTKLMTLYLTFDAVEHGRLHLDQNLIVSKTAANASPVKIGLSAGSKITVENAIKAVAVYSANDIAIVLSENLTGDEGDFASLMTRVAKEIGLTKTHFENSSGLPNADHLSSARDIALLTMALYKHYPNYWKYFGIKSWSFNGKTYNNGNRLLGTYPGADGMKTGYTNSAKYCLVATAKRDGRHILSVVLGAPNKDVRADVSRRLLDRGFATPSGATVQSATTADWAQSDTWEPAVTTNANERWEPVVTAAKPKPVSSTTSSPATSKSYASGNAGVQFGAYSSRASANAQAGKVKSALGISVDVEPYNNLFRVRANGLSDAAAQKLKSNASASGIDSYVFH